MKKVLCIIILLQTISVYSNDDVNIRVHSRDNIMKSKHYSDKSKNIEIMESPKNNVTRLSPEKINQQLILAGIETAGFDQLDKDMLYYKSIKAPISYLLKKYPTVSKEQFIKLKSITAKESR